MEYIDVLDEKGQNTGKSASKKDVHEKGLWHRTVHVWFTDGKGNLLLQLRSKGKESHPGMWDISAAGHISAGEESIEGALREIEEEVGLSIPKEEIEYLGELVQRTVQNGGTYINNEYNDVYLVTKELDVKKLKLQPDEVDEVHWITITELQRMVSTQDQTLVPHPEEYALIFQHLRG